MHRVSKTLGKKHPFEVYLGGGNLPGYFQKDPIIAADETFGKYFDASLVRGPVAGDYFIRG